MTPDAGAETPLAGLGWARAAARRVRRRRALYLHGFDPAPTERYRRVIARAGALIGLRASLAAERALSAHLMLAPFDFALRLAATRPPSGRMEARRGAFDFLAAAARMRIS